MSPIELSTSSIAATASSGETPGGSRKGDPQWPRARNPVHLGLFVTGTDDAKPEPQKPRRKAAKKYRVIR